MILQNDEIEARLSSPENLLNRLAKLTTRSPVSIPEVIDSSENLSDSVPSVADLVDNLENKLTGGKAYTNALNVLAESTELLRSRIGEVRKPEKLSKIASDMSRIVNGFNEKNNKNSNNNTVIVYKPVVNNESHYETVYANE